MSYATPEDVAVELRGSTPVTPEEATQWQAWIDRVERSIERAFRRAGMVLAEQVALGDPTAADVVDVEVAAVIRKIQNPMWGRTSSTRSLDDGSVTYRNEGTESADPLELLADELNALLPQGEAAAFSTRPYFESDREPIEWWT